MYKESLVKCIYLELCDVPCAFKKGVKFEHLRNTVANIPGSDTEHELNVGGNALHRALSSQGWWISCKRYMFGSDYSHNLMNGRIHLDYTEEFEDGVRYAKRDLDYV